MSIEAVGTDSRSLPPASLFVALRGDRFDGHDFVEAAVRAGARAVLVDREGDAKLGPSSVPRLVVADTLKALGQIARHARMLRRQPVLAVTGSNGKTTTKELIAAALSTRGEVHKTEGNLNNLIGLPLTLLRWPESSWACVVEMGMNARHEIERLAEIAAPQVGIITVVGAAHLEGLGTIESVARAKGELFERMPADGVAVVNDDDPLIKSICEPLAGARRKVRFGRAPGVDVRLVEHRVSAAGIALRFDVAGTVIDTELPLPGVHNAMNAAGAAAVAWVAGIAPHDIAAGLSRVKVPGSRLRVLRDVGPGVGVLDDTYNANPQSMIASFETLRGLASGRRVAVLGDMFELGEASDGLHREVGEAAAASGIAWLLALGPCAPATAQGARSRGAEAKAYESMDALVADLDAGLQRGDWVVVKGSRGMQMERVVKHLQARTA